MTDAMKGSRDRQTAWYRSAFEQFERQLNGEASQPFHRKRQEALGAFFETGFPSTHHEEWRYTDLSPVASVHFAPPGRSAAGSPSPDLLGNYTLGLKNWIVVIDGRFTPGLSRLPALPAGCRTESLADVLKNSPADVEEYFSRPGSSADNPFIALGTAFTHDGVFIAVPPKMVIEEPIHILSIATKQPEPTLLHPRLFVSVAENSQLAVIQTFIGAADQLSLTNALCDIIVGEGSVVEYDKIQREGAQAYHIATLRVHQARSSSFTSTNVTLGAALTRNTITAVLDGEGAEATLNGLYLGTGTRLIDNHTTIDHAKPHCNSFELYKGILSGRSRGVFNGKIFVRKDAQKTDAKQTNKNLILSDEAAIDTKPQLEIYANDVKCTHGATIGQLEEESLFYLRTRGISEDDARNLLIYAFASDVVERIALPALQTELRSLIGETLRTEQLAREKK
jgi:Fe-S cluster assembly protein SufD